MIRHAALFRLIHVAGSPEEAAFLKALTKLKSIPGVGFFQIAQEVSPKNPYTFAVSMMFPTQTEYDGYNTHPVHEAFVKDRWVPEVAEFMEHDPVVMT